MCLAKVRKGALAIIKIREKTVVQQHLFLDLEPPLERTPVSSHGEILIFTDGACSGNPGPGGWGAFIRHGDQSWELSGYDPKTTNNRMEMLAVICALQWTQDKAIQAPIILASDSQYVIKGITQWVQGWMRNGWKTSAKKPVENQDLWEKMWGSVF